MNCIYNNSSHTFGLCHNVWYNRNQTWCMWVGHIEQCIHHGDTGVGIFLLFWYIFDAWWSRIVRVLIELLTLSHCVPCDAVINMHFVHYISGCVMCKEVWRTEVHTCLHVWQDSPSWNRYLRLKQFPLITWIEVNPAWATRCLRRSEIPVGRIYQSHISDNSKQLLFAGYLGVPKPRKG